MVYLSIIKNSFLCKVINKRDSNDNASHNNGQVLIGN